MTEISKAVDPVEAAGAARRPPTAAALTELPPALRWVGQTPFFQGGLAGYSDSPMRRLSREHGCPFCVTEAMLDRLLIAGGKGRRIAELTEDDHPIAGQIIGSDPQQMAEAAGILRDIGHDVIDVNLACPVKKARRRQRGGQLMAEPDRAVEILAAVHEAVGNDLPVMVKLRCGYEDDAASEAAFHRIFSATIDIGYAAATVHPRTVRQKYLGRSHWGVLTELVKEYQSALGDGFLLFGSGDIFEADDALAMMRQTGVHGVAIARGSIGNPWVFRQVADLLAGREAYRPSIDDQRRVLLRHFELVLDRYGDRLAGRLMRKFGIRYSRHHPRASEVADAFIAVQCLDDWRCVLDAHYRDED